MHSPILFQGVALNKLSIVTLPFAFSNQVPILGSFRKIISLLTFCIRPTGVTVPTKPWSRVVLVTTDEVDLWTILLTTYTHHSEL
jgi:hypothetical protein